MVDILENWVKLVPGIEKKLRFSGGSKQARQITDATTKVQKNVNTLVLRVTMEDGQTVQKDFSITSERLAGEMSPYLDPAKLTAFEFTFLKGSVAFSAPQLVRISPVS